MAELPDPRNFVTTQECSQCGIKPAVFLHHVWPNGKHLHICTSCVLQLHQGYFCPICFTVYDDEFFKSTIDNNVKCTSCQNVFHFSCIQTNPFPFNIITEQPTGVAASSSSSSSSTAPQKYCVSCPCCVDPEKKIFEFSRDDSGNAMKKIDKPLAPQVLAAAEISELSMNKAVEAAILRASILSARAEEEKKRAMETLMKFDDLARGAHDLHQQSTTADPEELKPMMYKNE